MVILCPVLPKCRQCLIVCKGLDLIIQNHGRVDTNNNNTDPLLRSIDQAYENVIAVQLQ
jgi:hypothetical protein